MKGPECIYFSPIPWGSLHQRPQHMVTLLARERRVLFVEPRTLTEPEWPSGLRNIEFIALPVIPFNARNPLIRRLARVGGDLPPIQRLVEGRQGRLLRRACGDCHRPLLIFGHPEFYPLRRLWPDSPAVYDHMDDILRFGEQPDFVARNLRELVRSCDLVSASSRKLVRQMDEMGARRVVLAGNGVEWERFVPDRTPEEPADLAPLPHPRAIYVGSVAEWFDFELLFRVAELLPRVSFPVVGPLRPEVEHQRSRAPENVHFLGPRPYADVPGWLHHSDCALIPFLCNELTAAVDPVKLHEYFAAGLPVVATPFSAEMGELEPARTESGGDTERTAALWRVGTADEFAAALQQVLDHPPSPDRVRQLAVGNTWEARLQPLFDALGRLPR